MLTISRPTQRIIIFALYAGAFVAAIFAAVHLYRYLSPPTISHRSRGPLTFRLEYLPYCIPLVIAAAAAAGAIASTWHKREDGLFACLLTWIFLGTMVALFVFGLGLFMIFGSATQKPDGGGSIIALVAGAIVSPYAVFLALISFVRTLIVTAPYAAVATMIYQTSVFTIGRWLNSRT
jgi:hypothetical protein